MSTDRELLELAARAVGGVLSEGHTKRRIGPTWDEWEWIGPLGITINGITMHPQFDSGDALWLAAKLRLAIVPGKHAGDGCTVETQRPGIAGCTAFGDDECEQMRRAILVAAANVGKAMPWPA